MRTIIAFCFVVLVSVNLATESFAQNATFGANLQTVNDVAGTLYGAYGDDKLWASQSITVIGAPGVTTHFSIHKVWFPNGTNEIENLTVNGFSTTTYESDSVTTGPFAPPMYTLTYKVIASGFINCGNTILSWSGVADPFPVDQ